MSRSFRWVLLIGLFVSTIGDEISLVALLFKVVATNDETGWVATLFMAQLIPAIICAPFAGKLVDETDAAKVAAWACLLQGAILGLLTLAPSPIAVIFGAALLGALFAVSGPAIYSLVPLVAADVGLSVRRINSVMEIVRGTGTLIGPALGGALVAWAGTSVALIVDAATFLILAALLLVSGLRRDVAPRHEAARWSLAAVLKEYRPVLRDPLIVWLVAALAIVVFSTSVSDVLYVFLVQRILLADALVYGLLVSVWAGGILLGSYLAGRRTSDGGEEVQAFSAAAVMGLALLATGAVPLMPWLPTIVGVGLAFAVGGTANGVHNVAVRTLLHVRVPADMHGKAFAVYTAANRLAAILGFMVGGIIGAAHVLAAYAISGLLALMAGIGGQLALRQIRRTADSLGNPEP